MFNPNYLELVKAQLTQFATQADFETVLKTAFGTKIDRTKIFQLRQQWLKGDFSLIPPIEVLTNGELGTANGGYAASEDKIFVSSDLIAQNQNNSKAITGLLLEEFGHKIDRFFNGNVDSAGDEGDIFSRLVRGETLSAQTLAGLKAEDDTAVIIVDGRGVSIEQQDIYGNNLGNLLIGDRNGVIADDKIYGRDGNDIIYGRDGDDEVYGENGNDVLAGEDGNDTLDGGYGNDELYGGFGNDILAVVLGHGKDYIDGESGIDMLIINNSGNTVDTTALYRTANDGEISGGNSNDTTFKNIESVNWMAGEGYDYIDISAATGDNTVSTSGGNDYIKTSSGNDRIYGEIGEDTIESGTGADRLEGGSGNDYFYIRNESDTANTTITYVTATSGTISGGLNDGTTFNDIESGGIWTGSGNDKIDLAASAGDNFVQSGAGNDTIYGGSGNDRINAGKGADIINGGGGKDLLNIGDYDYPTLDTANTTILYTTTLNGTVAGGSSNGTTFKNVEIIKAQTGSGNDKIDISAATGDSSINANGGNDTLIGGAGNDYLFGGTGNDTIRGGAGNDIYNTRILLNGIDYTYGEIGNDTYIIDADVDLGTDTINETVTSGIDTLDFSTTSTKAININLNITTFQTVATGVKLVIPVVSIENVYGGTLNDTITGNSLNNSLNGDSGNDTLNGETGNDILNGGSGSDALNGGNGDDTYVIDADVDTGTDTINETLLGGGIDTLDFRTTTTKAININLNTTTQTVATGVQLVIPLISIENVYGGSLNDTLTGNSFNNVLLGGAGNDTLNGGTGGDTLDGGIGNDTLNGDDNNDVLRGGAGADALNGGTGIDYASYYYSTTALAADLSNVANNTGDALGDTFNGIEYLQGSGTANSTLTGDINNNYLISYGGNDILNGGAGIDYLSSGAGNDTLNGGAGNDTLVGGTGNDRYLFNASVAQGTDIISEATLVDTDTIEFTGNTAVNLNLNLGSSQIVNANLVLTVTSIENVTGGMGNDLISGNFGNNTLNGGAGNDTLSGGFGNDSFLFKGGAAITGAVTVASLLGKDTISDFSLSTPVLAQDKIVLSKGTFAQITTAIGGLTTADFASFATDAAVLASNSSAAILYSSGTGNVFYNQNGNVANVGANGGIFATVTANLLLTFNDFSVVA